MSIDKVSKVQGSVPVQRRETSAKQIGKAAEQAARTDSFVRSTQGSEPNYVKYPYGAPELAMAVLATAATRIPKSQDEIPPEESKDADPWLFVEKTDKAAASHNNQTHHYNQEGKKNPEGDNSDLSDEVEE